MDLSRKNKVFLLAGVFSFFFSYLITTLNYFPHLGMALTIASFTVFSYLLKKEKNSETRKYFFLTLVFSTLLVIRSEGVTTFMNVFSGIFFGSMMLLSGKNAPFGILLNLLSPLFLTITSLLTKSDYYPEFTEGKKPRNINFINIAFGVLASIFIIAIILPLLASTNPIFEKFVWNFWSALNIENILNKLGTENLFLWSLRLVFFLFFIFIIPRMLTVINKDIRFSIPKTLAISPLPLDIPKFSVLVILLIFFATEIQFYFADAQALQDLGISYSQHAREVFGQLSLVAGIVFLLIFNDRSKSKFGKALTWLLGFQGIFLTLIAFKSVFEYVNAWGLTYKRLYGFTFATFIFGIFIIFLNSYRQKKNDDTFINKSIVFTAVILIIVNILNFDYLIYHFRKAETGQGVDYVYLTNLSADSLSYKEQVEKLEAFQKSDEGKTFFRNNYRPYALVAKIDHLQNKYEKFDLRTFNLLDYLEYLKVKDIDKDR